MKISQTSLTDPFKSKQQLVCAKQMSQEYPGDHSSNTKKYTSGITRFDIEAPISEQGQFRVPKARRLTIRDTRTNTFEMEDRYQMNADGSSHSVLSSSRQRSLSNDHKRDQGDARSFCSASDHSSSSRFEGDRFINFRGNDDVDMHQEFQTKQELFKIDHQLEEEQRIKNYLVSDHQKQEQTIQEIENKKTYTTLLQNQILDVQNEDLLNEIHNSDENHFQSGLYTQMQRKSDGGVNFNTPNQNDFYCGAFAFTSPPERVLLSDTTNQQDTSPFNSRYNVLKFNSANKNNSNQKKNSKSLRSQGSGDQSKNFQFAPKPGKLLDLKIEGSILDQGIFSMTKEDVEMMQTGKKEQQSDIIRGIASSTNTSFSNLQEDNSFIPMSNKENPFEQQPCFERRRSCYEFRPHVPQPTFKQNPFTQGIADDQNTILPQKKTRKIAKIPYKVLDAPQLRDDYYLNLVDWSDSNNLAVALSSCVYIWSASSSAVTKLHDYSETDDLVASVAWSRLGGQYLATGNHTGTVHVWDTETQKLIRTYEGHVGRVGALSWSNSHILSSGSKDKTILNRDLREPSHFISRYEGHRQEICGLKWSFDDQYLASGGNDNKLMIWGQHQSKSLTNPLFKFSSHKAAVKAIAWNPHQSSILATGGGTADRCIKFWNTRAGVELQSIETGSQVCNLMFSKSSNEIVSTHGYSDNAVVVWKYPSLKKIATLTGHSLRVLYLAMSPDGETVVTGAGDETLRFWKLFPKLNKGTSSLGGLGSKVQVSGHSNLDPLRCTIR